MSSSGVMTGVQDEGSQAGDEEITELGSSIMLPENCELGFQSGLERLGSYW